MSGVIEIADKLKAGKQTAPLFQLGISIDLAQDQVCFFILIYSCLFSFIHFVFIYSCFFFRLFIYSCFCYYHLFHFYFIFHLILFIIICVFI